MSVRPSFDKARKERLKDDYSESFVDYWNAIKPDKAGAASFTGFCGERARCLFVW